MIKTTTLSILATLLLAGCTSDKPAAFVPIHVEQTGWGIGKYITHSTKPISEIVTFRIIEPANLASQQIRVTCANTNSSFGPCWMPAPQYIFEIQHGFLDGTWDELIVLFGIHENCLRNIEKIEPKNALYQSGLTHFGK